MLSEVFYVGMYSALIGFVLAFTKMIYKSKCKSLRCCGCELIRDTEAEEKIDELEIERHHETKEENLGETNKS